MRAGDEHARGASRYDEFFQEFRTPEDTRQELIAMNVKLARQRARDAAAARAAATETETTTTAAVAGETETENLEDQVRKRSTMTEEDYAAFRV